MVPGQRWWPVVNAIQNLDLFLSTPRPTAAIFGATVRPIVPFRNSSRSFGNFLGNFANFSLPFALRPYCENRFYYSIYELFGRKTRPLKNESTNYVMFSSRKTPSSMHQQVGSLSTKFAFLLVTFGEKYKSFLPLQFVSRFSFTKFVDQFKSTSTDLIGRSEIEPANRCADSKFW